MSQIEAGKRPDSSPRSPIVVTLIGVIFMVVVIILTLEVSHRHLNVFVATNQKYIISVEGTILVAFIVELLARLTTLRLPLPQIAAHGASLRLIIRIIGYSIGALSIISILASNATLGISVGAVVGIVIAFATQNIMGSVLAAVLLLSTRMVRVGEEISISGTTGTVADINLTHTVLSIDDMVVFVPNSLVITSMVRRKKRRSGKDSTVYDW